MPFDAIPVSFTVTAGSFGRAPCNLEHNRPMAGTGQRARERFEWFALLAYVVRLHETRRETRPPPFAALPVTELSLLG